MKRAVPASENALLLIALIALALNLRSPFTAVAPLIAEIRGDLGISKTVAGLLTTIPVLCFGLLAPLASRCIARTSVETSVFLTLIGTLAGIALRSAGGIELALAGTLLIGASITIGNIASLVVIARDFPGHVPAVMGLYTSALNIGPMLTAGLSEPLAQRIGWRWALAAWGLLSVVAIGLWSTVVVRRRSPLSDDSAGILPVDASPSLLDDLETVHVLRRPVVWLLVAAFAAHLLIYYSLSAWLPAYLHQAGGLTPTLAGLAAAFFQLFALAGTLGVPAVSSSGRLSQSSLLIVIAVAWIITTLGFLIEPRLWPAWCVFGGFASGGGVTVIFMLGMTAAQNLDDNRHISAAIQGLGYAVAGSGPVLMGALNEYTGGWRAGFVALTVWGIVIAGVGLALARLCSAQNRAAVRPTVNQQTT